MQHHNPPHRHITTREFSAAMRAPENKRLATILSRAVRDTTNATARVRAVKKIALESCNGNAEAAYALLTDINHKIMAMANNAHSSGLRQKLSARSLLVQSAIHALGPEKHKPRGTHSVSEHSEVRRLKAQAKDLNFHLREKKS